MSDPSSEQDVLTENVNAFSSCLICVWVSASVLSIVDELYLYFIILDTDNKELDQRIDSVQYLIILAKVR